MNYKSVRNIVGRILTLLSFIMLLPLLVCLIYNEPTKNYISFAVSSAIVFAVSIIFRIGAFKSYSLKAKDGLMVVGLAWTLISIFGCLPFFISGEIPNYVDALFETVSGFTTTGSSILTDVEALSHSMLFYRSFIQWIGGMGVLVFILTITSDKNEGNSIHLLRAESTGPSVGKLSSKMKFTTRILYFIYLGLTILEILLLWAGGNGLFTSTCLSLTTMATGGYGVLNSSIADYSIYSQYVIIVFMFFAGINFSLYYYILIKKIGKIAQNEEFKTYLLIIFVATTIIAINVFTSHVEGCETIESSIRHSLFTVVSLITTTGFATIDFAGKFPALALSVIVIIMFIGSCAGSTAGGMKISRVLILAKNGFKTINNKRNEDMVSTIKIDGSVVSDNVIRETQAFFLIYIGLTLICTFLGSIDGSQGDFITNFSASLTCISNIGPGLGNIGAGCFASYSGFAKVMFSIEMLVGRLEIFPILMLFNYKSWLRY